MSSERKRDCAWVADWIDVYVDGDLNAEDAADFESHLSGCESCRVELALAERVMNTLATLPKHTCPDRVLEKAVARIEGESSASPRWFGGNLLTGWIPVRYAVVAAAAVVAIAIFAVTMQKSPRSALPTFEAEELAVAEKEVEAVFAYLGFVGQRSAMAIGAEVVERGLVHPAQKTVRTILESEALPFKDWYQEKKNKEPSKCG